MAKTQIDHWEMGCKVDGIHVYYSLDKLKSDSLLILKIENKTFEDTELKIGEIAVFAKQSVFEKLQVSIPTLYLNVNESSTFSLKTEPEIVNLDITHLGFQFLEIENYSLKCLNLDE